MDVGDYNSIAFNPYDGLPYISYYNATHEDLMLASPQPNGTGNCGDYGDWWCRAADGDGLEGRSTDDTGQYSSIAFWKSGGDAWKLGISYYNATTHGLRYAVWVSSGAAEPLGILQYCHGHRELFHRLVHFPSFRLEWKSAHSLLCLQ